MPEKIDSNKLILFELFKQIYEDVLSLIICIPNTTIKEIEINNLNELSFKQIVKENSKKNLKCAKLFNYSSNQCNIKSNDYQPKTYPYQNKDIMFKIKSLTLSPSSHDNIRLFMENQLTCLKIVSFEFKEIHYPLDINNFLHQKGYYTQNH